MKKSLRFRMTLWFTLLLLVISGVMLYGMLSVLSYYDRKDAQSLLRETVEEKVSEFRDDVRKREAVDEGDESRFSPSDFIVNGVQIEVFHSNGRHSVGVSLEDVPTSETAVEGEDEKKRHEDRQVQMTEIGGKTYYLYDAVVSRHRGEDFRVRGMLQVKSSTGKLIGDHLAILWLVPVFILVGAAGGYLLIRRFLYPVEKIIQTQEKIKESGDLSGRIVIRDNGDEFSRIAQGFNGMLAQLQENFEAEKQFASNASHELRTPVAVILAQCDYAFDNAKDMDDMYTAVEAIQRQGYVMSHLIELLLIFTRIQQKTEKYPAEELDLGELIRSVGEDFELITQNRRFVYRLGEKINVRVNRELFTLVISNLIRNAVRYGKEQGTVALDLKKEEDGRIVFSVTDDGVGIPEEELPRIWERFYRGEMSRCTKGTGLGLPLVREIVHYYGGEVSVSSEPGVGSTFSVILKK